MSKYASRKLYSMDEKREPRPSEVDEITNANSAVLGEHEDDDEEEVVSRSTRKKKRRSSFNGGIKALPSDDEEYDDENTINLQRLSSLGVLNSNASPRISPYTRSQASPQTSEEEDDDQTLDLKRLSSLGVLASRKYCCPSESEEDDGDTLDLKRLSSLGVIAQSLDDYSSDEGNTQDIRRLSSLGLKQSSLPTFQKENSSVGITNLPTLLEGDSFEGNTVDIQPLGSLGLVGQLLDKSDFDSSYEDDTMEIRRLSTFGIKALKPASPSVHELSFHNITMDLNQGDLDSEETLSGPIKGSPGPSAMQLLEDTVVDTVTGLEDVSPSLKRKNTSPESATKRLKPFLDMEEVLQVFHSTHSTPAECETLSDPLEETHLANTLDMQSNPASLTLKQFQDSCVMLSAYNSQTHMMQALSKLVGQPLLGKLVLTFGLCIYGYFSMNEQYESTS